MISQRAQGRSDRPPAATSGDDEPRATAARRSQESEGGRRDVGRGSARGRRQAAPPPFVRGLLYAALALLILLHNDLWFWDDPTLILGLPIGLVYHIGYAVAASLLMLLLVALAFPSHLEVDEREDRE